MSSVSPIVHVGLQKTASTFLQKEVFGPLDGFHTPWGALSADAIEHFVLAHSARFDSDRIRHELEPPEGKVTVISHEDLIAYPIFGRYYADQTFRRIARALPDARVLLVIREQRSILLSNYFQQIRQGGTLSISQMLAEQAGRSGFRPRLRLDHFEYDLTYTMIREHFEDSQILMLPFEFLRHDKAEFIGRLSRFSGVDIRPEAGSKTVHSRRGTTAMRVERVLNKFAPNPANLPSSYDLYPLRVRTRNRIVNTVDRLTRGTKMGSGYLEDLQGFIDDFLGDYFDASNRRLCDILQTDLEKLGYRVAPSSAPVTPPSD